MRHVLAAMVMAATGLVAACGSTDGEVDREALIDRAVEQGMDVGQAECMVDGIIDEVGSEGIERFLDDGAHEGAAPTPEEDEAVTKIIEVADECGTELEDLSTATSVVP